MAALSIPSTVNSLETPRQFDSESYIFDGNAAKNVATLVEYSRGKKAHLEFRHRLWAISREYVVLRIREMPEIPISRLLGVMIVIWSARRNFRFDDGWTSPNEKRRRSFYNARLLFINSSRESKTAWISNESRHYEDIFQICREAHDFRIRANS